MAGQLGNETITTQNLTVVRVDVERGLIMVKGAVPGHEGSWVKVRDAHKKPVRRPAVPRLVHEEWPGRRRSRRNAGRRAGSGRDRRRR